MEVEAPIIEMPVKEVVKDQWIQIACTTEQKEAMGVLAKRFDMRTSKLLYPYFEYALHDLTEKSNAK